MYMLVRVYADFWSLLYIKNLSPFQSASPYCQVNSILALWHSRDATQAHAVLFSTCIGFMLLV